MESVEVYGIALPGNRPSVRGEFQTSQIHDGSGGAVLAGDPFGIEQGQGPGLDGNGHLNVKQASRRIGRIEVQAIVFSCALAKKEEAKKMMRKLRTGHLIVPATLW